MRTFAIYNRKGGVGKTTTAINLAYILATSCKLRVLLVDADSQGDASTIVTGSKGDGLSAVLEGFGDCYESLICHSDIPGLDVLPSGDALDDLDLECRVGKREPNFWALHTLLAQMEEDDAYDICVIDCPPYNSESCLNALTAANRLIIPTGTDAYSAVGMGRLMRQIDSIRKAVPSLVVAGALVTDYAKSDVGEDALTYLSESGPVPLFNTRIRRSPKVEESTWAQSPVCSWSPFSAASKDYRMWVSELMRREGIQYGT